MTRRRHRKQQRRQRQHQRNAQRRHRTAGWHGPARVDAAAVAEKRWEDADATYELALVLGNVDQLRLCLDAGCDPNCKFDRPYFETPLGLALCARQDGLQLLQFLPPALPAAYGLQAAAAARSRQHGPASRGDLLQCMKLLLARGARVDKRFTSTHGTVSCLHQAIVHDDAEAAELLLRTGASHMPRAHESALEMAVVQNAYACEKMLFKHLDEHPLLRFCMRQRPLVCSLQRVLCKYVVADEHLGAYRLLRANVPATRQLLSLPHTRAFCRLFACFGYACRHRDWSVYLTCPRRDDPGSFLQDQLRQLAQSPVNRQPAMAGGEAQGEAETESARQRGRADLSEERAGGSSHEGGEEAQHLCAGCQGRNRQDFDWDGWFASGSAPRSRLGTARRWSRARDKGMERRWQPQLQSARTQGHPVRHCRKVTKLKADAAVGAEPETAGRAAGGEAHTFTPEAAPGSQAREATGQAQPLSSSPPPPPPPPRSSSSSSSSAIVPGEARATPASTAAKRATTSSTPACNTADKHSAGASAGTKRAKRAGQEPRQPGQGRHGTRASRSERISGAQCGAGAGGDGLVDELMGPGLRASGRSRLALPRGVDAFETLRRNPQAVLGAHTAARPVPTLFARAYAAALLHDKLHHLPQDHRASVHAALFQPAFRYLQHFFLHSTQ